MYDRSQIDEFLRRIRHEDGVEALSEAKVGALAAADQVTVVAEGEDIQAVGVVAAHPQPDGSIHWAVETTVLRSMRFPEFESAVLAASTGLVPSGEPYSVWSSRSSLSGVLESQGFTQVRSLAYMGVDLPLHSADYLDGIRPVRPDERAGLVAAHTGAFAGHREAGSLSLADLDRAISEPWFDYDGLLVVERDGTIAGFCWTRVHANGDGEIYRIGVVPDHQGIGIGRALLVAGFHHLESQRAVSRGTLWVDTANVAAMTLYSEVGMSVERVNREFEPSG